MTCLLMSFSSDSLTTGAIMRPKDLGFADPCQRCLRNLIEGGLRSKELLEAHGHLKLLKDEYPAGGRFCTQTFACRRCGSRWVDWVLDNPPWVELNQESTDGLYYERGEYYVSKKVRDPDTEWYVNGKKFSLGRYVDGKKHGLYRYYRYGQHGGGILILSDLWDHGRLVEWHEYGPYNGGAHG